MEQAIAYLGIVGTIFSIIGIPSVIGMAGWCVRHCVKITKDITTLQRAVKAQMRAQLLKDFETYKERENGQGSVLQVELDEWMNQYKAYHALVGENEVLDSRKDAMLEMKVIKL